MMKHITMETIQQLYHEVTPKSLGIADLGCSSGPNSLSLIKDIVEAVEGSCHKTFLPLPEFRVFLNDLPTNDFNSVFKTLPDFYRDLKKDKAERCPAIFIAGYPGSFYGRVFPNNCLHFIYSSYSLHWLSKVLLQSTRVALFWRLWLFFSGQYYYLLPIFIVIDSYNKHYMHTATIKQQTRIC